MRIIGPGACGGVGFVGETGAGTDGTAGGPAPTGGAIGTLNGFGAGGLDGFATVSLVGGGGSGV
jgi:hypothetical protein